MKTSLRLLFSLGSTLALVAAVVVFVQEAPDGSPSAEAAPNSSDASGVLLNGESAHELTERKPLRAPLTRSELKPRLSSQTPAMSGSPASPVNRLERGDSSANGELRLPTGEQERASEQSGRMVRDNSGNASKRIIHPQAAGLGLPGSTVLPQTGAPVANREPIQENAPNAELARAATSVPQASQAPISPDPKVDSSPAPAPVALSAPAKRVPWPRGPFTPEEELYRAQYGAAALSDALREEALGPEKP